MNSCPMELKAYEIAHKRKIEEQDYLQHLWWGKYGISAFIYAIDHTVAKSPRAEFVKEPILSQIRANRPLTEEEKEQELERFVKQNERMRKKWRKKKERKEE